MEEVEIESYKTKITGRKYLGFLWILPFMVALVFGALNGFIAGLAVSCFFWVRLLAFKKKRKNLDIVERIQDNMGLDFVIFDYAPRKIKGLMGGYMMPLFPWYSKVMSKSKFIEATIHEHMHIWFMVYGGMTPLIYFTVYLFAGQYVLLAAAIMAWMIINEVIAFEVTHIVAKEMGFKTRRFTLKTFGKYVFLYGSVLSAIVVFQILGMSMIPFLICVILAYRIMLKAWYIVFKKWGWIEDVEN